jgi:hypothetical protein
VELEQALRSAAGETDRLLLERFVRQRDGGAFAVGVRDELGQLFGRNHPFIHLDMRHLVLGVHVHA